MPKVRISFEVRGWCHHVADVPQSVIDEYDRMCEQQPGDGRDIDRLLEPYVDYDSVVNQLDDPEDIELTEIKESTAS